MASVCWLIGSPFSVNSKQIDENLDRFFSSLRKNRKQPFVMTSLEPEHCASVTHGSGYSSYPVLRIQNILRTAYEWLPTLEGDFRPFLSHLNEMAEDGITLYDVSDPRKSYAGHTVYRVSAKVRILKHVLNVYYNSHVWELTCIMF